MGFITTLIGILAGIFTIASVYYAREYFKKSTTLEIEKFFVEAYQKYMDTECKCLSNIHKENMQDSFLMAIDICCKYVMNGVLDHELCGDSLRRHIQNFRYPIKVEIGKYENICRYMERFKLDPFIHEYFATKGEILKAGFLINNKEKYQYRWNRELIIGTWKGDFLVYGGDQFVSLAMTTETIRKENFIIPNCLNYQNNLVVNDPKGAYREISARYREEVMGHDILIFEPFSEYTHRYNPFYYVDFENKESNFDTQIKRLSELFFTEAQNPFLEEVRSLFCLLLHIYRDLYHSENGKEFCKKYRLDISDRPTCHLIGSLIDRFKIPDKCTDLFSFINILHKENVLTKTSKNWQIIFQGKCNVSNFSAIQNSYVEVFKIFENPCLQNFTHGNDIDFRDLRKKKIDIFFTLDSNSQSETNLIARLFFTDLIMCNMRELAYNPSSNRVCCMIMDAFETLGYLQIFEGAVGGIGYPTMAGYGMQMVMACSDDVQLEKNPPLGYGENGAKSLRYNCVNNLYYQPSNKFKNGIDRLSQELGALATKKIIESSEDMEKEDDFIFLTNKCPPIRARKIFYLEDSYFTDRLLEVSPHLSKHCKKGQKINLQILNDALQSGELDCEYKRRAKIRYEPHV
ncbi:type IV secretory system conjugative DNA transfer family protein [Helicobacter cynogastricus]|uniref:type IV secretory system conjugative DNA transfer family protein n=1 Tax=Helicobacter cynogastricus TaxID=329937 RepID=UPI000CF08790|nr:type IV secretory system conjugative DNA transfer family protein [Helicobacter cynogastricus]